MPVVECTLFEHLCGRACIDAAMRWKAEHPKGLNCPAVLSPKHFAAASRGRVRSQHFITASPIDDRRF